MLEQTRARQDCASIGLRSARACPCATLVSASSLRETIVLAEQGLQGERPFDFILGEDNLARF